MNKGPFYSIKEYPYMDIIQANWMVFKDEIPYFNIDKKNSMMSRTQSAWNNKEADELVNKLGNCFFASAIIFSLISIPVLSFPLIRFNNSPVPHPTSKTDASVCVKKLQ